ncbi:MAG TPA: CGNR zinc finger domain-containing protein [Streptosporangiaceae bacterium]|jgi:predicted RNA-binding Zn ribbon-like protein
MSDPAVLLQDFVNTLDVEKDADDLGSPTQLTGWLADHGLLPAGAGTSSEADLTTAIKLREGLRAAMLGHHGPGPYTLPADLDDVLAELPVRVSLTADGPSLVPAVTGVAGGLSGLVAAIVRSDADGTWPRLKVCLEDTCRWAFLDTSKNRSRSWCSMRVCGNRTKTRAYRARRRAGENGQ